MRNKKRLVQIVCCLVLVFSLILPVSVAGAWLISGQVRDERSIIYLPTDSPGTVSVATLNMPDGNVTPMVAADHCHTVGLKSDGTVIAVGSNVSGELDVGGWTGIKQVAAGIYHTVGLKSDGTVVAVGDDSYGQCYDVDDWTGIVQVTAGQFHTVGLKSDGTVVAVGNNFYGQLDVGGWTGIAQVAAGGFYHTVGLKYGGTVVAVGNNLYGQLDVGGWTGINQVAAGYWNTVGLKSNGTVVVVGDNTYHQCNVGAWTGIVQVSAGEHHTVGLKSDGTVIAKGDNSYGQCNVGNWTGIVQVSAGRRYTVGLKANGLLVWVGDNSCGQCNLFHWNLTGGPAPNNSPNTPSNPSPSDDATNVSINADLCWSGGDPDGDTVLYDVYFGTSSPPPLVSSNQSATCYDPGTLNDDTKYYWKIIAKDNYGGSTTGPLWDFTTLELPNNPPNAPSNPSPANHATNVSIYTDLSWTGGDPNGDTVTYDVYFDTAGATTLVSNDQSGTTYNLGTLGYPITYYWKIVATDEHGASTTGPMWDFTTQAPPGYAVCWDLEWGLDQDPTAINIYIYKGVAVNLATVEATMPNGLLIWYYGGPGVGYKFYKKGWGAYNTLTTLVTDAGVFGIVPTASVWCIPQD